MFRRVLLLYCLAAAQISAPAENWYWSNPMPHGNAIIALNYYAPAAIGIEACDSGQIYTSLDLANWTAQDSQTTNSLQAIAFLGNRVIITGQNGTVVYSDDGYDYTCTNLNTTDWLVGVAASSTLAVAVGDNAVIYTSPNGAQWTLQSQPPGVGDNWLLAAAYGAGTFVIVGEGGYLATSTNGTNWTQRVISGLSTANINDIKWISPGNTGNGFPSNSFLASCDGGKAYYSVGGTNWTAYDVPGTNSFYSSAGNSSNRLVVGVSSVYLGTNNNPVIPWRSQTTLLTNAALDWTYYCAMALTNTYLIGGESGMFFTGAPNTNGAGNYSWAALDSAPRDWLWDVVAVSNLLYVAVGDNARIMTSLDGVIWDVENVTNGLSVSLSNTVFFGVGGTTNLLLAVGTGGAMSFSPNNYYIIVTTNFDGSVSTNTVSDLGIQWINLPALETNNDLQSVAVWGTNFYVVGGGGSIYYSGNPTNAASWSKAAAPTTNYLSGIDVFSNMLVCVGDAGTILTSSNGVTWAKQSSPVTNWLFRVRSCRGTFLAVGENGTILTSSNGIEWLSRDSGTTNWLNDAQMVTNSYYVVGDSATVLTSADTTNWTMAPPIITDQSLYSAATINGQLVVAGVEGSILRSQIVPDLNPLEFISFGANSNECVFYVGTTDGNTDVNFTLDSTPDLIHWTTGPEIEITDASGAVLFSLALTNAPATQYYRATIVP
jgi:hypothetical protein